MSANHQPIVNLDNNATTQVDPAVFEAMLPWLRDEYGNPSSVYSLGKRRGALDIAREQVAALINCAPGELTFTSCGSESINSAILSAASIDPDKTHIVTTAVEHSATIKLCEHLARRGYEITWLSVDGLRRLIRRSSNARSVRTPRLSPCCGRTTAPRSFPDSRNRSYHQ